MGFILKHKVRTWLKRAGALILRANTMNDTKLRKRWQAFADAPFFRHFPRWAGCFIILLGATVIVGWLAHWTSAVQILPQLAPMKFNTALSFVLCGISLALSGATQRRFMPFLGGATALIGLATLMEYFINVNLGLDQLFVSDHITTATLYPGRMSQLSSSCFVIIGIGFVMAALGRSPQWQLTVPGLSGGIVMVVAGVALAGYLTGVEAAYGWGAYTRMALHTAVAFFILGSGLLVWAWQKSRRENFNFLRWLPVTGSVTLMVMVAFVSAINMGELEKASYWRQHAYRVISATDVLQNHFIEAQRAMRGYVTASSLSLLPAYREGTNETWQQFNHLVEYSQSNSNQLQHLQSLGQALQRVWAYNNRLISIYEQQGAEAVFRFEADGEGRKISGQALDNFKTFHDMESRLLDERDAVEQAGYRNAENLLVFGSILAALLLVFANWMASHELAFRQRIETKLNQTLLLQNAILNSANYGIVSTNPKGVVQTFNPAAEQLLGYPASEVIGKNTPLLWRDPREIAERAEKLSQKLGLPVRSNFEAIAMKVQFDQIDEGEWTFVRKDGSRFPSSLVVTALTNASGQFTGFLGIFRDISERKKFEAEREKLILELQDALAKVKTLSGLIPICGWCKKIRSDKGYLQTVEQYVLAHTGATFSHGMCPDCAAKFKADVLRANADSHPQI